MTTTIDKTAPALGVPSAPPLPPKLSRPCCAGCRTSAPTPPDVITTAKAQRWGPAEVLRALFGEETAGRDCAALATRRSTAGFPTGRTSEVWDEAASSVPAPTQRAPRTPQWVHRKENLVVCGPSGTGKTFLLEGLKVFWFTLEDVGALLRRHRADGTVAKAVARLLRAGLVIDDIGRDIGLLPIASDAAEGLYRLVDPAYETRSVAISSNLHPAGFGDLLPKTIAPATIDRPLHHAHVCQTSGESVRLSQALTGRGVKPLVRPTRPVMASTSQIPWPSPGRSRDRHRAGPTTVPGQLSLSLDIASRATGAHVVQGRQPPMSTHADSSLVVADSDERDPHE